MPVLLPCVALRHLDQIQTLVLLFLALRATEQHRLVNHHVQDNDDNQADQVHARVELLVVPLEVAAEDEFVRDAVTREHDEDHVRRRRQGLRRCRCRRRRREVVHREKTLILLRRQIVHLRTEGDRHAAVVAVGVDGHLAVDAVHEGHDDAEDAGEQHQTDDRDAGALQRDSVQKRVADTEVTVDGDGRHRQRRERDVGRDEEQVDLTDDVVVDDEVDVLHVDRERDDNEARNEVDEGQREDKERRHEVVALPHEHVQYHGVAAGSKHAQERQDHHDGVHLRPTRLLAALVVRDVRHQQRTYVRHPWSETARRRMRTSEPRNIRHLANGGRRCNAAKTRTSGATRSHRSKVQALVWSYISRDDHKLL